MIPREIDFTKQEISNLRSDQAKALSGPSSSITPTSSSITPWSRLKDPRIVRVSKAFGGKDRHSKVCTVRGLRDRRVRLSVPTAIQLYDLQDRLGLSQPSKVVDWLLNAAKDEIDELPPLQVPPGTFQQILAASQAEKQGLKVSSNWNNDPLRLPRESGPIFGGKIRVSGDDDESANWGRNDIENQEAYHQNPESSNSFPSRENLSGLMHTSSNSNCISYSSYLRFDPSNLSLSHPPRSCLGLIPQPQEDWHNFGLAPLASHHQQVLVYQPGMITQSYFPNSQIAATTTEFDPKQVNFQSSELASSLAQPFRPIHFMNMANASPLPSSQNNYSDKQRKGSL